MPLKFEAGRIRARPGTNLVRPIKACSQVAISIVLACRSWEMRCLRPSTKDLDTLIFCLARHPHPHPTSCYTTSPFCCSSPFFYRRSANGFLPLFLPFRKSPLLFTFLRRVKRRSNEPYVPQHTAATVQQYIHSLVQKYNQFSLSLTIVAPNSRALHKQLARP